MKDFEKELSTCNVCKIERNYR